MTRRMAGILALAVVVAVALAVNAHGQAKPEGQTGLHRIEGSVTAIDKEKSTISLKEASSANITWRIEYDKDTAFTYRNEDGKLDDVQVGRQVICIGKYDEAAADKTRMKATRIDVRAR